MLLSGSSKGLGTQFKKVWTIQPAPVRDVKVELLVNLPIGEEREFLPVIRLIAHFQITEVAVFRKLEMGSSTLMLNEIQLNNLKNIIQPQIDKHFKAYPIENKLYEVTINSNSREVLELLSVFISIGSASDQVPANAEIKQRLAATLLPLVYFQPIETWALINNRYCI